MALRVAPPPVRRIFTRNRGTQPAVAEACPLLEGRRSPDRPLRWNSRATTRRQRQRRRARALHATRRTDMKQLKVTHLTSLFAGIFFAAILVTGCGGADDSGRDDESAAADQSAAADESV